MPRVVVREGEAIRVDARRDGRASAPRATWDQLRQRREVRAGVNRLVNFDDANLRRSAQAAVAACARVERALEILADEVPDHLREAGELRLAHRDASLDELGHHADPPLTKDAVAGRIRRLLAMADKKAEHEGIPGTEAAVPVGRRRLIRPLEDPPPVLPVSGLLIWRKVLIPACVVVSRMSYVRSAPHISGAEDRAPPRSAARRTAPRS